jgi:hypothetical protein
VEKRPSIYLGEKLAGIIRSFRGDLDTPSVSGIINAIASRYQVITAEATPTLTEAEWSLIADVLNGCSALIGTGGADQAAYVWAEVADAGKEYGYKWGVDTVALASALQGLSFAGRCAVWDVAARFWASPKLNEMPAAELLREVGAKIK